jgi:hypothetical protein
MPANAKTTWLSPLPRTATLLPAMSRSHSSSAECKASDGSRWHFLQMPRDAARIGPTCPGSGPGLPAATIGLMKVVGHRTGSAFGRALDSEPDLLAVGELERMAVGVGDARDIADRVAGIDRGAGRPALATSFGIEPVGALRSIRLGGNHVGTSWRYGTAEEPCPFSFLSVRPQVCRIQNFGIPESLSKTRVFDVGAR